MKCLLLDVGSTRIKYSFYETESASNSEIFFVDFPAPAVRNDIIFEVDLSEIKKSILQIFGKALRCGCKRAFLCVQMHGYCIRRGKEFSNYISWRDIRGKDKESQLKYIDFKKNGTSLKKNLPIVSLCTQDLGDQSEFFTLGSYIAWFLTGSNITHKTDACATGFFDRKTLRQNIFLFKNLKLPKVCEEIVPIGDYKGISVYTPVGDHQASFLGSGVDKSNALMINVGTATQITAIASIDINIEIEMAELRPYFNKETCLVTVTGISRDDPAEFSKRIKSGLEKFENSFIILGGGGAYEVLDELKDYFERKGLHYMVQGNNVGNEGLKKIADSAAVERGTMLSEIAFQNFPIIMKRQGLDFIIIDDEHGIFDDKSVAEIAQTAKFVGLKAIVRLPNSSRQIITKLADSGVSAFLLPMTDTAEDIKQVIKYAKYSPAGSRGISTTRAHTLYGVDDMSKYMSEANRKMQIYAQIETVCGVGNIKEILRAEGLEGIFIGPNDLADDIGCIGDIEPIKKCIDKICSAAKDVGKPCGIITNNLELLRYAFQAGISMFSYGSEINMLKDGAKKITRFEIL